MRRLLVLRAIARSRRYARHPSRLCSCASKARRTAEPLPGGRVACSDASLIESEHPDDQSHASRSFGCSVGGVDEGCAGQPPCL